MWRILGHRLLTAVPTVIVLSLVVFALGLLLPGDPAVTIAGDFATAERLEQIRQELGLNNPIYVQYWDWASNALIGSFGQSLLTQEDVSSLIMARLPPTLQIVLVAILFSVVFGVPLGVAAARRPNSLADNTYSLLATLGVAVPAFWLGMVLVLIFSVYMRWFPAIGFVGPSSGMATLTYTLLPAAALGASGVAEVARQLRASLIETLDSPYIRTARAGGLPEGRVLWNHGVRNAAIPAVTVVGLLVNRLIGSAVVVEGVFGIPGLGTLILQSVQQKDLRTLQAVVLVIASLVIVANLLVDLVTAYLNPRVRNG
jgi:peptide/nickel transport system permease protein